MSARRLASMYVITLTEQCWDMLSGKWPLCLVVNFHFLTSLVLPLGWCKRTAGNEDKQKAIRYRKISFISQVVLIFQTPTHFFLYAPKSEPICQPIGELTISHIANLLRVSLAYLHMEKMASLIQWA